VRRQQPDGAPAQVAHHALRQDDAGGALGRGPSFFVFSFTNTVAKRTSEHEETRGKEETSVSIETCDT
jgi:hypothetical protein